MCLIPTKQHQDGACNNYDSNGWDGSCMNCGMPLAYHDIYRSAPIMPRNDNRAWCFDSSCIARHKPIMCN